MKKRLVHALLVLSLAFTLFAALGIVSGAIIHPQTAHASLNSSQLVFDDGAQNVYSIKISGPNQTGTVVTYNCLKTPNRITTLNNWWWATTTYVYTYSDSNCSHSISPGTLWFSSDNYAYRCLEDTYPYRDYDAQPYQCGTS